MASRVVELPDACTHIQTRNAASCMPACAACSRCDAASAALRPLRASEPKDASSSSSIRSTSRAHSAAASSALAPADSLHAAQRKLCERAVRLAAPGGGSSLGGRAQVRRGRRRINCRQLSTRGRHARADMRMHISRTETPQRCFRASRCARQRRQKTTHRQRIAAPSTVFQPREGVSVACALLLLTARRQVAWRPGRRRNEPRKWASCSGKTDVDRCP